MSAESNEVNLPEEPARRVRALMAVHGPETFKEVAKAVGCHPVTISALASGHCSAPGVEKKLEILWGAKIRPNPGQAADSDRIKLPSDPRRRVRALMATMGPGTFTEIAKQIGCNPGTIRGLIAGRISAPGIARKLEIVWGCTIWPELKARNTPSRP
jgi:plasmid maintenance system antidote protein VapI